MRDYTVIIPSRNPFNLKVCLASIDLLQLNIHDKILVYDNDPTGEVRNVCQEYDVGRIFDNQDRPFVFSRAVNACIAFSPGHDVILLNDDTTLSTREGFDKLHFASRLDSYGIVSAGISGFIGNPEQMVAKSVNAASLFNVRPLKSTSNLAFVCVHILHEVLRLVGPFDERLIHYGWEDTLYCLQTRAAGFSLGVFDGCIIEHGTLPSTYRGLATPEHPVGDKLPNFDANRIIFEEIVKEKGLEKWRR